MPQLHGYHQVQRGACGADESQEGGTSATVVTNIHYCIRTQTTCTWIYKYGRHVCVGMQSTSGYNNLRARSIGLIQIT